MVNASRRWRLKDEGRSSRIWCCVCVSHGVPAAAVGTSMMFLRSDGGVVTCVETSQVVGVRMRMQMISRRLGGG